MINLISILQPTKKRIYNTKYLLCFKSRQDNSNDTFVKQTSVKNFTMRINNPHTYSYSSDNVSIDLSKQQKIILKHNNSKSHSDSILTLDYNPDRYGYIKNKKNNKPLKTFVLIGKDSLYKTTSYHFMSENLEKEYGYVIISDNYYDKMLARQYAICEEIYDDYPELGIIGPRITVDYLKNLDEANIGGIGDLADQIEVIHCLKNNIKPVIVSMADKDSHIAHYLRGKRFLPPENNDLLAMQYMDIYGTTDINEIVKNLILNNKDRERISTKHWPITPMYMPQEKIKEILESLKDSKELLC